MTKTRELMEHHQAPKRYVLGGKVGQFHEGDGVVRSLSADRRTNGKIVVKATERVSTAAGLSARAPEIELREVDRHVDEARERIAVHNSLITQLEIDGRDTREAREMLQALEDTLHAKIARREQILRGATRPHSSGTRAS